ncbi:extracellular solute-binding protein [Streptomyces sp. NPDC050625]|jgi:putative spermidine/putrescine transport system substrate-binding protein|uniref:extracellular solute-binding protein n=1 Tax=Streptomyces sp. NPDC050625 TaxID=3154629 RepID=UPI003425BCB0
MTAVLAAIAATTSLAACGGSSDARDLTAADLGGGPPKAGVVAEGVLKGEEVVFVGYGGEVQDRQVKDLDPWVETSGATVKQDSPTDTAKLEAQVKSKKVTWDAVDATDTWAAAHCDDLLTKLDDDIIDRSQLPDDNKGTECGVPFVGTGNIFAYNADTVKNAPRTWGDFFDTKKFPGKRALYSGNPVGIYEAALMADGVAAEDLYPLDVDRALKKLDTIKNDLVFWSTGAQSQQMVESGQADMGIFWSGRVLNADRAGANWEPVYDRPVLQYDVMVVPKGSANPVAAMSLINHMLGKEYSEKITEGSGYPSTNKLAKPKVDKVTAKFVANSAPYTDPVSIDSKFWAENLSGYVDQWTTWING